MTAVSAFIGGLGEIDRATLFLFTVICGSAVWIIRYHVSSVFVLLLVFPFAFLGSMVAYHAFELLGLFNIKKMAEWLIWTIVAGSAGAMVTIGATAMLAALLDTDRTMPKALTQ
jgi:hypothetical protein